ncbi:hypothetical protein PGTUg99_028441 [Puccinia graminis f. sp. tritici]|uniref:Secreted protein n=1 Tax=Puccinia graminis f. sp. tritici TaxID=56615 RepID=A0A5B0PQU6_PUCGR|nr:hypothetical protein PGTUg99_028441 [Puccinia graminis f. sp. tritici]
MVGIPAGTFTKLGFLVLFFSLLRQPGRNSGYFLGVSNYLYSRRTCYNVLGNNFDRNHYANSVYGRISGPNSK